MGSCQSVPVQSTPGKPQKTCDTPTKIVAQPPEQPASNKDAADTTKPSREKVTYHASSSGVSNASGGPPTNDSPMEPIEETERTSNESFDAGHSSTPTTSDNESSADGGPERAKQQPVVKVDIEMPLKTTASGHGPTPLHKRNSSCSSYDSWEGPRSNDSSSALTEWKNELAADKDLTTAVVRIEVGKRFRFRASLPNTFG